MEFIDTLNEPQKGAVLNTEGPSIIIAGAGSGKTRVLTFRIAYMMESLGVPPWNILALTFTNKAAKEMRERIESVVGPDAKNLWMGTFHSVFAKILRFEAERLGYTANFTIYDTDDSRSLIRSIIKELNLDDKIYKPNNIQYRISSMKNNLISWKKYIAGAEYLAEDELAGRPETGRIYKIYSERCFKANAMDFDDLLFNTNVLLKQHPDVCYKYQNKFRYVLVDEFQDTNVSQYLITRTLAAIHKNICVVGDDAQSIYSFRGANIQNILNFERDYPELATFKLEQNYRSTKNIVDAANSVIARNKFQIKKNVWTANGDGAKISLIKSLSDIEEGRMVAGAIFEAKMNMGLSNHDFAVLYRTNAQSRSMEEALRRQGIKYRIIGGLSFYQRKEIKDLLAYIRFTINPTDEEAFKRIINLPKRGIGDTSVNKMIVTGYERNLSIWEVLENCDFYLPGNRGNKTINSFALLIKSFQVAIAKKDAYDAAAIIAKDSGLLRELFDDKTVEGRSRYDNVQELLNAVKEFTDNPENEDKSLGAFLQQVALLTGGDGSEKEDTDVVTLMTIHGAKGLEFPYVFVVGMEEDLFPSQMMLSAQEDLEEERRLFYVAITRAKEKLCLSYALQRYRYGKLYNCEPSRFLEDVDPRCMSVSGGKAYGYPSSAPVETGGKAPLSRVATYKPNGGGHTATSDFVAAKTEELAAGQKVEHQTFGFGKIVSIDKSRTESRAQIKFERHGLKTLILAFAKLMIHPS